MENKLLYFHFFIGDKTVKLIVAQQDGAALEQAVSPLNFEDNLFSALNVLHRLMTSVGNRGGFQPKREFIRKIGRIQASLLNMTAPDGADPVEVQVLFEKHWKTLAAEPGAGACFTFDFANQAPYAELAELPWEFLSYQNNDLAVADAPGCDFIRKIPTAAAVPAPLPAKKDKPLCILLIISEPEPESLRQTGKSLIAYRESYVYRLLRIYENLSNAQGNQLQLRVLFQPRPTELQPGQPQRKAVDFGEFQQWFQKNMVEPDNDPARSRDNQEFKPHIVHFLGHVWTDDRDEELLGCVTDENKLGNATYQAFTGCFAADPPALMILQVAEGLQMHRGLSSQNGILADLAQRRLPYILTFQHPFTEQGSLAFLRELYARLFTGQTVPQAVTGSRIKLARELGDFVDPNAFGSPTLYTTLSNTASLHRCLFSTESAENAPPDQAAAAGAEMKLPNRIEAYGNQIRRLVESNDLETALRQFKEITEIAARTHAPEADPAIAERYRGYATSLLQEYNYVEDAYRTGDITEKDRYQRRKNLGFRLQEYFGPAEFPTVATKPAKTAAPPNNPSRP